MDVHKETMSETMSADDSSNWKYKPAAGLCSIQSSSWVQTGRIDKRKQRLRVNLQVKM